MVQLLAVVGLFGLPDRNMFLGLRVRTLLVAVAVGRMAILVFVRVSECRTPCPVLQLIVMMWNGSLGCLVLKRFGYL